MYKTAEVKSLCDYCVVDIDVWRSANTDDKVL